MNDAEPEASLTGITIFRGYQGYFCFKIQLVAVIQFDVRYRMMSSVNLLRSELVPM